MEDHNTEHICNGILFSHSKGQTTDEHNSGWISETCLMKEARHARVHTVWFHLFESLVRGNPHVEWQKSQWLPKAGC